VKTNLSTQLLVGLLMFSVLGCARPISMTLRSTPDLNNGGYAVAVRIYQLKSAGKFQRATFDSFWGSEDQTLGTDLANEPMEIRLYPGERRMLNNLDLQEETSLIGVAANFNKPDGNRWKTVFDLSNLRGNQLVLAVGSNQLLIDQVEN